MRRLTITAAAALLLAGPAFSETTTPAPAPTTNTAKPSATTAPPASRSATNATTPAEPPAATAETAPRTPATPAATGPASSFLTAQSQDQWLVSNLVNSQVYDAGGKSAGDLSDIIVNKDGTIAALVIGSGGFLGLGQRSVAVDFNYVKQHGSITPNRIVLGLTADQLAKAPAFESNKNAVASNAK